VSLFRIRAFRPADLDALAALVRRADKVDNTGFATSVEDLAYDLTEPGVGETEDILLAEAGDELIGHAILHTARGGTPRMMTVGIVDPDWRRHGVGTALMLRAQERALELLGDKPFLLDLPVRQSVAGARELAQSLGYVAAREFLYMVCPDLLSVPEPVLPAHIGLRDYVKGQDEAEFAAAYTETFADHWGEEPHTVGDEQHRTHAPSFRPQDNLLAINGEGAIVGLCLLQPYTAQTDGTDPGMIEDLGVRPAYRGQGIGRALLLAGMKRLGDQGAKAAALFVDADSPYPSIHLYRSVGFAACDRTTIFRKEMGGPSCVTR
jgi:mycothiol synthase